MEVICKLCGLWPVVTALRPSNFLPDSMLLSHGILAWTNSCYTINLCIAHREVAHCRDPAEHGLRLFFKSLKSEYQSGVVISPSEQQEWVTKVAALELPGLEVSSRASPPVTIIHPGPALSIPILPLASICDKCASLPRWCLAASSG